MRKLASFASRSVARRSVRLLLLLLQPCILAFHSSFQFNGAAAHVGMLDEIPKGILCKRAEITLIVRVPQGDFAPAMQSEATAHNIGNCTPSLLQVHTLLHTDASDVPFQIHLQQETAAHPAF